MPGTICFFGTYDPETPRNKLLKAAWEAIGGTVVEANAPIWPAAGARAGLKPSLALLGRWLAAGRRLRRLADRVAAAEAILVPYPGHLDVHLAHALGRKFGKPVVFDPFLSFWDTAVGDRGLVSSGSPVSWAFKRIDVAALRRADVVLADTGPQADFYARLAGLPREKVAIVPIGADDRLFEPVAHEPAGGLTVLFYGSMIPLHGVEVIVEAARRLEDVRFQLIGEGQVPVEAMVAGADNISWAPSVPYEALPGAIAHADVVLGIFGTSEKARRVVPHKVYEAAAMGKAIVTADTPAMREAFDEAVAY
ncbi:MAG: glycosyltransferase, partial [Candidatus Sericytochromatia bacterium]